MEKPRQSTSAVRRTLAQALTRLFKSAKAQNADNPFDAPVDIIRKDPRRESYLPRISRVSLFPDFECPDTEYHGVEQHLPSLPMPFSSSCASQDSTKTLLPARSLSHFDLRQVYTSQTISPVAQPRQVVSPRPSAPVTHVSTGKVPSHKPVLVHKKSTLQIRRPESLHASISTASLASTVSDKPSTIIRRSKGSCNLRECAIKEPFPDEIRPLTTIAEHISSTMSRTSHEDTGHLVRHFASFCIIDILAPGCPVTAVSEDLRYLYDIKDRFVLNAQECSELSMDFSVGRDPDGNEVTYVLLFSPLVSPTTSKSRFVLVSAIDVTGYIRYAATLESNPEPREEPKLLRSFSERVAHTRKPSARSWIDERTDQLADELLHGCSIRETDNGDFSSRYAAWKAKDTRGLRRHKEDVWTAIAREEGLIARKHSVAPDSTADSHGPPPPMLRHRRHKPATAMPSPPPSINFGEEKVIESFIGSLQVLYSQYFLLACSPLNGDFYEICYVSPAVYASGEYVSGHLSHTPFELIREFGVHLARGKRFRKEIWWGDKGVEKQLYCVPLIGKQPAPWICMLVDKDTPIHW